MVAIKKTQRTASPFNRLDQSGRNNTMPSLKILPLASLLIIAVLLTISLTNHQPSKINDDYLRRRVNAVVGEIRANNASPEGFREDSADDRYSLVNIDNGRLISADEKSESLTSAANNHERDHNLVHETVVNEIQANSSADESVSGEVENDNSATSFRRDDTVFSKDGDSQEEDNEVMNPILTGGEEGGTIHPIAKSGAGHLIGRTVSKDEDGNTPSRAMDTMISDGEEEGLLHSIPSPVVAPDEASSVGHPADQTQSSSNGPISENSVPLTEVKSSTNKFTLREQLLARSLETKQLIRNKLQEEVSSSIQNPRYSNHYKYSPQRNQVQLTQSANLSCDQEDAFSGIPIDNGGVTTTGNNNNNNNNGGWVPPGGFPMESIQKWDREYKASMRRIKEVSVGGSELREFAKTEVERLRGLRHNLFCRDF
mmetsp:Transcript_21715/g.45497  ORF Transcript_21715/g.45497 Transcript_21715/m.45497 type:complete len:427 (+) Transcript_21715:155-1435(+)